MRMAPITTACRHYLLAKTGGLRCWWCGWKPEGAARDAETVDDILEKYGHAGRQPVPSERTFARRKGNLG